MNTHLKKILNSSFIMNSFSELEVTTLLKEGKFEIRHYNKNTVLHFDGDVCDKLEILLSGSVVIDRIDPDGNMLTITEFTEGGVLGANLVFSKLPNYMMTITASADTEILEIKKDYLFFILTTNPIFLKTYLEFISDLTAVLGNKIKTYIKRPLRNSIVMFLKQEMTNQHSSTIKLNTSKKALAEMFGVERTSLSRELSKMEKENLIEVQKDFIKINIDNITKEM